VTRDNARASYWSAVPLWVTWGATGNRCRRPLVFPLVESRFGFPRYHRERASATSYIFPKSSSTTTITSTVPKKPLGP
jgi:hypothetical protein